MTTDQNDELARLREENARLRAQVEAPGAAPPPPAHTQPQTQTEGRGSKNGYLAVGIGLFIIAAILFAATSSQRPAIKTAADSSPIESPDLSTTPIPELKNWAQSSSKDEMRGTTDRSACLTSNDPVYLEPPYRPTKVELCFRKTAKFGHDAYLLLQDSGQFLCRSYEACTVRVKVDAAAPSNYSAIGAKDGSPEIIFFQNSKRLEAATKSARTIVVEAEFYRAGVQQMKFETESDLEWQTD